MCGTSKGEAGEGSKALPWVLDGDSLNRGLKGAAEVPTDGQWETVLARLIRAQGKWGRVYQLGPVQETASVLRSRWCPPSHGRESHLTTWQCMKWGVTSPGCTALILVPRDSPKPGEGLAHSKAAETIWFS